MVERHEVATTDDFDAEGDRVFVEIDELEVAVFLIDGEYHALVNYCPHQGAPLCEGELTGESTVDDDWNWTYDDTQRHVRCPWHGWVFDVTSGESTDADQYRMPSYEVELEDDTVYVLR